MGKSDCLTASSVHTKKSGYQILDIDIDGLDVCFNSNLCCNTVAPIPLYKYSEIPLFLKSNPYVVDGYTSLLPFSTCLKRYRTLVVNGNTSIKKQATSTIISCLLVACFYVLNFSLFCWNNETINVWSHLLGFLLFFGLMLWDLVVFLPSRNGTIDDYVILSIGLVSFQVANNLLKVFSRYKKCTVQHSNRSLYPCAFHKKLLSIFSIFELEHALFL